MVFSLKILIIIVSALMGFVISGIIRSSPNFLPDVPNARSSHSKTVPRGGGIAFIIPFIVVIVINIYRTNQIYNSGLLALLAGCTLMALIGLLDDLFTLPVISRIFFQIIITITVSLFGAPDQIELFGIVTIQGWPVIFIQTAWLLVCINFFNFMDGIDGLATGQAIFISTALGIILYFDSTLEISAYSNIIQNPFVFQIMSLGFFSLSAALTGFLLWNFPPARLFMGDTGSCFLGFLFGFTALVFPYSSELSGKDSRIIFSDYQIPLFVTDFSLIFLLLYPFLLDSASTLIRRFRKRRNLFQAHREHMYQLFYRSGYSAIKINLIFFMVNMVMLCPVIMKIMKMNPSLIILTIALIFSLSIVIFNYTYRRFEKLVLENKK